MIRVIHDPQDQSAEAELCGRFEQPPAQLFFSF